jgi:hypothetical protein
VLFRSGGLCSVLRGFEDEPVRRAGVLPEVCDQLADLLQGEVLALPPDYDPFADEMIVGFAAGPHITAAVRALLPVVADFRPHLVLRAGIEFAGVLVAERLGGAARGRARPGSASTWTA